LINEQCYSIPFATQFGGILTSVHYTGHQAKWSDRIKNAFLKLKKPWNDATEEACKLVVGQAVYEAPENALKKTVNSSLMR